MFIFAGYKFLEHLRDSRNASEHTIRNYSIDLNSLKKFIEDEILDLQPEDKPDKIRYLDDYDNRWKGRDEVLALDQVDRQVLRKFMAKLSDDGVNKRTIVRRISSLRSFFRFGASKGWVKANPTEDLESPKLEKRIPYSLSYDEIQRIFDQPDTSSYLGFRDRTIMELFYSSGLRVSELVGLNREDMDFEELTVLLRGKGKKERVVPITKNAAEWVQAYLEHAERHRDIDGHGAEQDPRAIFLNKLGTRLSARSVDRKFDKYITAAGLAGKVTPHTIRHTIATHWLENGMPIKMVQMLLGHSSLATTTIYTKVSKKLAKKTHQDAHPREQEENK